MPKNYWRVAKMMEPYIRIKEALKNRSMEETIMEIAEIIDEITDDLEELKENAKNKSE